MPKTVIITCTRLDAIHSANLELQNIMILFGFVQVSSSAYLVLRSSLVRGYRNFEIIE